MLPPIDTMRFRIALMTASDQAIKQAHDEGRSVYYRTLSDAALIEERADETLYRLDPRRVAAMLENPQ